MEHQKKPDKTESARLLKLRQLRQKAKYHAERGDTAKSRMFQMQHDRLQKDT